MKRLKTQCYKSCNNTIQYVGRRDVNSVKMLLIAASICFLVTLLFFVGSACVNYNEFIKAQPELHQYQEAAGLNNDIKVAFADSQIENVDHQGKFANPRIIIPAIYGNDKYYSAIGYISLTGELGRFSLNYDDIKCHLLKDDSTAYANFVLSDKLGYESNGSLSLFLTHNVEKIDLYLSEADYTKLFATNTKTPQ